MSYDGIVMRAVALELNRLLPGARIDKIYQPGKSEIILALRQPGHSYKLLLSAQAQEAAVFLTTSSRSNPQEPPLFCMVLRKHLEGGKILSVTQQGLERVLEICCESYDDMGDKVRRKIMVEVMGKHSNVILLDPQTNKIIDSIQRITPAVSRYRQILPGFIYQSPPPQDKVTPWEVEEEAFYRVLMGQPLSQKLSKAVLNLFAGLSPQSAEEIIRRANLDPALSIEFCGEYELSKLWRAFNQTARDIENGQFASEVVALDENPLTFSALALTQYPQTQRRSFNSMNEALDFFYSYRRTTNILQQKKGDLAQIIKKELERCERKAGLQMHTVQEAVNSEHFRLWGELLTAYQHSLTFGREVEVVNYHDPDQRTLTIPLEEDLSILDNAQRYYKKYQKAKQAAAQAQTHLTETRSELEYLYSLASSLEAVTTLQEVDEIKEELQESGYLKAPPVKKKTKGIAGPASLPAKLTREGWDIYYGKNNKQNDLIVTKLAKPDDVWFHTKDIPGSHVLIKNPGNNPIPDRILESAALLAAYHSRARLSTHVPVDYTFKKHVWKQKGTRPGMVNYDHQRTIYVTPHLEKIEELMKGKEL